MEESRLSEYADHLLLSYLDEEQGEYIDVNNSRELIDAYNYAKKV